MIHILECGYNYSIPWPTLQGVAMTTTYHGQPCRAWRCDIQGAPTGKLAGKTVAIKDNTAVAGVPMRNGSKILQAYVAEFDATIVSRILDAGKCVCVCVCVCVVYECV